MTKDSPRNSVLRDEELIKRLRAGTGGGKHWMDLHEEAADRIEQLVATNEALVKDKGAGAKDYCALMDRHDALFVRSEQLAATCERLESALKWQAEQPEAHPFMVAHALTALKGTDHE